MKFHPILFSTPMVHSILDDSKTMTRRIIDPQPIIDKESGRVFDGNHKRSPFDIHNWKEPFADYFSKWVVGDVLWVRETHYRFGYWVANGFTKKGNQKWMFKAISDDVRYFDDPPNDINHPIRISRDKKTPGAATWYKRLARFMPKSACRIFLEIKSIKVERLQEISEADAIAEGILQYDDGTYKNYSTKKGLREEDGVECLLAKGSFQTLWMEINGIENWKANPWVWVIEFERIEKPKNFIG